MSHSPAVSRFHRQLGLVNQRRVEDLVVRVDGAGGALPYLLTDLVLLGVGRTHGGILLRSGKATVEAADVTGQFLLTPADVGQDYDSALVERLLQLDPEARIYPARATDDGNFHLLVPAAGLEAQLHSLGHVPALWGQTSCTAICVGSRPVGVPAGEATVLSASLRSLCGAVLAQELLLRSRCLRQVIIAKSWTSVNYHLRGRGIAAALRRNETLEAGLRFRTSTGELLRAFPSYLSNEQGTVQPDEVILRVPFGEEDRAAGVLADSIEVFEELAPLPADRQLVWSPFAGVRVEDGRLLEPDGFQIRELAGKKVFVAGVGALGSWLSLLFSVSGSRDCTLTLVDMDGEVTRHNLNRQVLYTEEHLNQPKAQAACHRLQGLNPANRIQALGAEIDPAVITAAAAGDLQAYDAFVQTPAFQEIAIGGRLERVQRNPRPVLAHEILTADAVAGCLDNLKTRYVLNVLCESAGIPFINAAAQEFDGRAERIDPRRQDPCLVCRLGELVKTDETRIRCTEEGDVPIQSIVTTSAIAASVQTLLLVLSLAGADGETFNWLAYDGRQNLFRSERSRPRWPDECPGHLLPDSIGPLTVSSRAV